MVGSFLMVRPPSQSRRSVHCYPVALLLMASKVVPDQSGKIRLRLSAAQIDVLAPGIRLLLHSYKERQRLGTSPLAYPFPILPPPRGFDRGSYNQELMDKIIGLWEAVKTRPKSGRRVNWDTWQLRAAVFAIRAYLAYLRFLRGKPRQQNEALKAKLRIGEISIASVNSLLARLQLNSGLTGHAGDSFFDLSLLGLGEDGSSPVQAEASGKITRVADHGNNTPRQASSDLSAKGKGLTARDARTLTAKSRRLIASLERHMKRANRSLIKAVGKKQYANLTVAWQSHLRWMHLHIVYCKPWAKPLPGRRARQQRDLDELMEIAKRGLREEGFSAPQNKELRRLMRLYARYARQGRIGMWRVGLLHEDKERFLRKYHLAQFVIKRTKLKELSKS